jgi:ribonucleoside-diphosphate reductase subunit M2
MHDFQAAAAIEAFSINSPTKPSKKATVKPIDDPRPEVSPATIEEHGLPDDLEVLRQKFVGEVDLPESMWHM